MPAKILSLATGAAGTPVKTNSPYDHLANRWIMGDRAFPAFPGSSFSSPSATHTPSPTPTPCSVGSLSQDFDSVDPPALPPCWAASNVQGAGQHWATTDLFSDSPPNDAEVDDPSSVSDKRLESPRVPIQSASAVLTFRNSYDLENGFDGGVLEISIGGGPFADILAAGGGFVSNGYNATIPGSFGNPLGGRVAWSGNSGGYLTTVVNLPASAAGQNVVLRWRMGSDDTGRSVGWRLDNIRIADGAPRTGTPTPTPTRTLTITPTPKAIPMALLVDSAADGASSDGNGILEPGESVFVRPSWKNQTGGTIDLTGVASNYTGPVGPVYTLKDSTADYGSVAAGATNNCATATGNCYEVSVSNGSRSLAPASRPATHWDTTLTETLSDGDSPKLWTLHVGESFADVPRTHKFYQFVERILHFGVTTGCTLTAYCPDDSVFRLQVAVFIGRAQAGGDANVPASGTAQGNPYNCAGGGTSLFSDIDPSNPFCRHVHYIFSTGVTTGCVIGPPRQYCPSDNVTRGQMALFIGRAVAGSDAAVPLTYGPDLVTGRSYSCNAAAPNLFFTDVTTSDIYCRHTHYLWAKNVISGFPDGSFGPALTVTRGAMAKFLANGFNLTLYKP